MARYIALIYALPQFADPASPDWQAEMAEHGAFAAAAGAAGVLVGGEALQAPMTATTISVPSGKGGDVLTADGPYAETKEVLSGFYILNCADLDEALKWAAQIPDAWHGGKVEVRPVIEFDQG
jgi:hypothetical protein